jgi:hypothetical protein
MSTTADITEITQKCYDILHSYQYASHFRHLEHCASIVLAFLDEILSLVYKTPPNFNVSEKCFNLSLLDPSEFVLLLTVMADPGGRVL